MPFDDSSTNKYDTTVVLNEIRHLRESLAEIKQTVSALPVTVERTMTTERRQMDSDTRFTTALEKVELAVIRIHDRLDDVKQGTTGESYKIRTEFLEFRETHRDEVDEFITTSITGISTRLDALAVSVAASRVETDSWVNKGKGAWTTAALVLTIAQGVAALALGWVFTEIQDLHDWRIAVESKVPNANRFETDSINPPHN